MTDKELFVYTLKDELPRFERVFKALEAIPQKKHSFRHHAKSRTALALMLNTFGQEGAMIQTFLKTGKMNFLSWKGPKLKTATDVRKEFMKSMTTVGEMAKKMNSKVWASKAVIYAGDKVDWESPRGLMAWSFLLDLIHHRGQLSTYLRPMGGKVPSIYGPSADEK